jgi:glycerol-3-phosphate cytidylyltransferase
MIDYYKKKYKKGITFGAFDPLHYGHIRLLKRAKEQCEHLIVAISSDLYIRGNKDRASRVRLEQRIEDLKAIKYVDEIQLQGPAYEGEILRPAQEYKKELIDSRKPDAIFVGDDWNPETFTGHGLGVTVVYLPRTEGISSTELCHTKE